MFCRCVGKRGRIWPTPYVDVDTLNQSVLASAAWAQVQHEGVEPVAILRPVKCLVLKGHFQLPCGKHQCHFSILFI